MSWYAGFVLLITKSLREIRTNVKVRMNLNTWNDVFYLYILREVETTCIWCDVLYEKLSNWIGQWLMCKRGKFLTSR